MLFLCLAFSLAATIIPLQAEKAVRGANPWGFFAEFLWAVNHLDWCKSTGKTPVIYWGNNFAYFHPNGYNGSTNGWEYYFEPVSKESYHQNDTTHHELYYKTPTNFSALWEYCQYIDNMNLLSREEQRAFKPIQNHHAIYLSTKYDYGRKPSHAYPVGAQHLYGKEHRRHVNKIINEYIKIKPDIAKKIESFYAAHIKNKKTIALHLRGNHLYGEVLSIPLTALFDEANKYADGATQFFIATDQQPLIQEAQKKLKGTVICYQCQRFSTTTSPQPGKKLDPKLGEDLLIEALLLSQCDHFIHTLSNVSTAVLYFNPELMHTLIY